MADERTAAFTEQGDTIDVPNPRVTDDDYFHGENPTKVGYGSRSVAHEGGNLDLSVEPGEQRTGQSTAEVQGRAGGAGWNDQANASQASSSATPTGEPDESWRNQDLRDYAEERGIDVPSNATKAELLDAINSGNE